MRLKDKKLLEASAFMYDLEKESVTHVKIDGDWVSLSDIAVEQGVSSRILNQLLSLDLLRRLQNSSFGSVFEETDNLRRQRELNSKIIDLISEYAQTKPEEVQSLAKALASNKESTNLTDILSVLTRKTNIPFRELAKRVADNP